MLGDVSTLTARLTTGTLLGLAGLHVAWGRGSSFPFGDRTELADAVVGAPVVPEPVACFLVAGGLATGGLLVNGVSGLPVVLRRFGLLAMAAVFGLRAALGFCGKTDLVSPGSDSSRFRRLDRRIYSPLCLVLAAGSLVARGEEPPRA
jgi:hypothetical protein